MTIGNGKTLIGRDWSRYSGASIGGGGFDAGTPASNLLTLQPQVGCVAYGAASFTLNLPAALPIGVVHLQYLLNVSSASISVGGYSASRSGPPPGYGNDEWASLNYPLVFVLPEIIVASSVNFSVSGSSPMIVGAAGACEAWQPPFDLVTGSSDSIVDLSDVETVPFGSTFVVQRPIRRRKDCALSYVPSATQNVDGTGTDYAAQLQTILGIVGSHLPVMVVPFPYDDANVERRAIWGLCSTSSQFTNQFYGFWNDTFQVTQLV